MRVQKGEFSSGFFSPSRARPWPPALLGFPGAARACVGRFIFLRNDLDARAGVTIEATNGNGAICDSESGGIHAPDWFAIDSALKAY